MKEIELLATRIRESARRSKGSELKLQGEVDGYLRETLRGFGIDYDPHVNKSLRRSYATSGKPDSLFGHVVMDYKAPGVLRSASGLTEAKKQVVDGYLKPISTVKGVFDPNEAAKWVGVLIDGYDVAFSIFNGTSGFVWTPGRPINKFTVTTLVQYYRALYRKPLDPHLLSADFGRDTDVAKDCILTFANYLMHPTTRTAMLFREWRRMFEQVSTYELDQLPNLATWAEKLNLPCRNDPALLLYCLHTYYALIVKLLTAELVTTSRQFSSESFFEKLSHANSGSEFLDELKRLEFGDIFRNLGIINFLEGDFFLWYLPHFDAHLESSLRKIIDVFRNYEPATPKLSPTRCKDLLKVFYSAVIDEQIRHDLGEYYTPDWLADLVLDRVGYNGDLNAKVLDPACGSGTFLVLVIQRFLQQATDRKISSVEIIDRIRTQIKGFDLNPLAVISARANYLLSISEFLSEYGDDIEIPIYLCDCINIPTRKDVDEVACLIYKLDTELGERVIALPESLIRVGLIGRVLLQAETDIVDNASIDNFLDALRADAALAPYIGAPEESILKKFYRVIGELEEKDWDQIWCRIIKNHFASQTISDVDYVVGNPPWVRWSRLPTSYRRRCKSFCNYYGLVSGRGYTGGIESDISTVVTYSAIDNWLKSNGTIGFLITATVYKSDSASGFRMFELPAPQKTPIFPQTIDDLVALRPFPDAQNETSLIVAKKGKDGDSPNKIYSPKGIPYTVWSLRDKRTRLETWFPLSRVIEITNREELNAIPIAERGSPLFTGSINDVRTIEHFKGSSAYLTKSHKGTTTDLARVYWVKVVSYDHRHDLAKICTLNVEELGGARTEGIAGTSGKWVESELLHPLIRGRDIGRFCYSLKGLHIIVPNEHYEAVAKEQVFKRKYPKAYSYFKQNETLLKKRSSYKRYQSHLPFYVIYDVGPYTFSRFKVIWMEQQNPKKFRACVISQDSKSPLPNKIIVPDHKLYMLSLKNEDEAHFVCGVLNSTHLSRILGGFLIGKQIGTSIFRYVGIKTYDPQNPKHKAIAGISKNAHLKRNCSSITDELDKLEQSKLDELVRKIFS